MNPAQQTIFAKAVNHMAGAVGRPLLYGPDNRPLPSASYSYSRTAAKRAGSMKEWIPRRLFGAMGESMEREAIAERAIDLGNNDPHAAGVIDTFATTVIGDGLTPHPVLDPDILGFEKEDIRRLRIQMKAAYNFWAPTADAGGRTGSGGIQFLLERCLVQFGEYLVLLPMLTDPTRPYSLACQVIHPMRMKTPTDKLGQENIRDGVELGDYGEPIAYWIKRSGPANGLRPLPDTSANFMRIEARRAHRWRVIHGYLINEPEQGRGVSMFAPAMKYFRDLNDYLDAELVSNIVTAAFSLFIETGAGSDPLQIAQNMSGYGVDRTNPDGETETTRYQEMIPGQIMYGSNGQKPHPIAANRPGATFDPFTKIIKKALSMALNVPYPVMFKDVDGVSFAGFRSAMLEAWRVFSFRRSVMGGTFCQRVYAMLMEEAYLRGHLTLPANEFYGRMHQLTQAKWRGAPKGDIEPIKAVNADILAIKNNLKTREEAISERGGDAASTFDKLEEENKTLTGKGLPTYAPETQANAMAATIAEAVVEEMEVRRDAVQ